MNRTYLSLGSNLGDREAALRRAITRLHAIDLQIVRVSPVYETAPMGLKEQPDFLNLVLEAETTMFPVTLLERIGQVERDLGRKRILHNGPRTIDVDILLYGQFVVLTSRLQIPHPRMTERRFVLQPLADLSPQLRHPISKKTIIELLSVAPEEDVRPFPVDIHPPARAEPA